MSYETLIKRIIYVATCKCEQENQIILYDNPPREHFCNKCKIWVPFIEESYVGPEIKK